MKFDENPIRQETIFEVQWTATPDDVKEEVSRMWVDYEYGNDNFYANWSSEEDGERYPLIDEFLKSRGVEDCLIHYWW